MSDADERMAGEAAQAEAALYRAMIALDYGALRGLLCEDLVYIHSTAVAESKEEYLQGLADGLYEYASIASRDAKASVHGEIAIQCGEVAMSVGARGAPKEATRLLFTLLWRREAGRWCLRLRQATRIPDRGAAIAGAGSRAPP
jgi:ketosteroid isomerase-like protein